MMVGLWCVYSANICSVSNDTSWCVLCMYNLDMAFGILVGGFIEVLISLRSSEALGGTFPNLMVLSYFGLPRIQNRTKSVANVRICKGGGKMSNCSWAGSA